MPCNHGDRKLFCVLSANDKAPEDIHNPYSKVLFRDFSNYLIVLAYRIYAEQLESVPPPPPLCLLSHNQLQ